MLGKAWSLTFRSQDARRMTYAQCGGKGEDCGVSPTLVLEDMEKMFVCSESHNLFICDLRQSCRDLSVVHMYSV